MPAFVIPQEDQDWISRVAQKQGLTPIELSDFLCSAYTRGHNHGREEAAMKYATTIKDLSEEILNRRQWASVIT